MPGISAWRRPWIVAGLVAWAAAMIVNGAAVAGVDLPDAVGWVLLLGVFPPVFAAVFTHPLARVRGSRARLGPIDALVGAWPPYIVLAIATLAYALVVGVRVGVHHVSMDHHLSLAEMEMLSALCAAFFATSTMVQSSARALEHVDLDAGP